MKRKSIRRRENIIAIYSTDWVTVGLKTYRTWCRIPYEGHPLGCHMWYSKRKNCDASFRKNHTLEESFEKDAPAWMIWEDFNVQAQIERMRKVHPEWSHGMLKNIRYWQATVKKKRNERLFQEFRKRKLWGKYAGITEGFCVNVYATCRNAGLPLLPIRIAAETTIKKLCFIVKYKKGGAAEELQKKVGRKIIIY